MEDCIHRGEVVSTQKRGDVAVEVCRCAFFQKSCTRDDHGIYVPGGKMLVCAGCPKQNAVIEQPKPPEKWNWLQRAISFSTAMANRAVKGRGAVADQATIESRLAICEACPNFESGSCRLCGCKVNRDNVLLNKLSHVGETCADKANPRW